MTDFTFITVYMPADGRTSFGSNHRSSVLINQECLDWLNENCGKQAKTNHEWILGLPENKHGWFYRGFDHDPASLYCKSARSFLFREESHALMFKLAWGG